MSGLLSLCCDTSALEARSVIRLSNVESLFLAFLTVIFSDAFEVTRDIPCVVILFPPFLLKISYGVYIDSSPLFLKKNSLTYFFIDVIFVVTCAATVGSIACRIAALLDACILSMILATSVRSLDISDRIAAALSGVILP